MMIKRVMSVFVLAGLLAGLLVTPAIGGGGKPEENPSEPAIEAGVSWTEGEATVHAYGLPGAPGIVSINLAQFISGQALPTVTHFDLPFTFDANGQMQMVTPLAQLIPWGEFDLTVEVQTVGHLGEPVTTEQWGMRLRFLDPASASTPAAPGGGGASYAVPGTAAPLYPYTWAALPHNGQVAYFQVAFTGIEGVIPVN